MEKDKSGIRMEYESKLHSEEMNFLFDAVLSLESREECYRFFEDICTVSEQKALAQRIKVAQMLDENATYQEISKSTGASTATISRVNRCLAYGSGGYRTVLDRVKRRTGAGDK